MLNQCYISEEMQKHIVQTRRQLKTTNFFVSQTFKFNEYIKNESSIKILIFAKDQFNSVGK